MSATSQLSSNPFCRQAQDIWTILNLNGINSDSLARLEQLSSSISDISDTVIATGLIKVEQKDIWVLGQEDTNLLRLGFHDPTYLNMIGSWHSHYASSEMPTNSLVPRSLRRGEIHLDLCRSILKAGCFNCICPWTGSRISSQKSFVVQSRPFSVPVYAYRFDVPKVFYILVVGSVSCSIAGVLIPDSNVYINFDRTVARDRVADCVQPLQLFLARNAGNVMKYLLAPAESTETGLLIASYHFAHHLWNELSCLEGLLDDSVTNACVWMVRSPFGPPLDPV